MLDPLGLARRARRIKEKQRMIGVDRLWLADRRLAFHHLVPPHIAPRFHRHVLAGAPVDDDALDRRAARLQRLIDGGLEADAATAAPAAVGGDDELRAGILDAVLQ